MQEVWQSVQEKTLVARPILEFTSSLKYSIDQDQILCVLKQFLLYIFRYSKDITGFTKKGLSIGFHCYTNFAIPTNIVA